MTLVMEEKQAAPESRAAPGSHFVEGLPVAAEIAFSDHKDRFKKGLENRQTKWLEGLAFLNKFLQEDEVIFLVTRGCSPVGIVEQFLTGWIVFYLRRSLFVFTNKRIFHLPANMNFSYRNSIGHIHYGDCEDIRMRGRTLVVRYKSGKKEKFVYVDRRDRKKLKALLKAIPLKVAASQTGRRTHLCPRCTVELPELVPECPKCKLQFLTKSEGRRLSIVFPGGGYFYTRHPWLGIGDAFAELYLLGMMALFGAEAIKGDPAMYIPFGVFGVMLLFEKLFTIYHANHFLKEFLPRDRVINWPKDLEPTPTE